MREGHRRLAEATTRAYLEEGDGTSPSEYGLRWGLRHWMAAGDTERETALATHARFLADRCRAVGVDEVRRDVQRIHDGQLGALENLVEMEADYGRRQTRSMEEA